MDHRRNTDARRLTQRRRDFISLIAVAIALSPVSGRAQQKAMPAVGCLSIGWRIPKQEAWWDAWRKAVREAGFVDGRNLTIEYRWADRNSELRPLASELVDHRVDLIFATSGVAARAAKEATSIIPIVFAGAVDPVGLGLVDDLRRPAGNVTGVASLFEGLAEKRLELLHEIVPGAASIGYLFNPENPNPANRLERIASAGRTLGVEIVGLTAAAPEDIGRAIADGQRKGIGGIVVADDPVLGAQDLLIVGVASRYRLPIANYASDGGLLYYGVDYQNLAYQAGTYVGRILRGEKPADLPVMEPTKFVLVIDLKVAKTLGLTVPQSLVARADEVIE